MEKVPSLSEERPLWEKGYLVIGIDEVGRGAFAGPLCVGGVVFKPDIKRIKHLENLGINDSKKLKPNKRKLLAKIIQNECLSYSISTISVAKINHIGVGRATFAGMRQVVKNIRENLDNLGFDKDGRKIFVLIDKFYVRHLKGVGMKNQKGIIKGDGISLSIAAASIIAKVYRDNHMKSLSAKFPSYGWGANKGYGTLFHRTSLKKYGNTNLHRKDFIKNII
jgi:ribonuclease HII